MANEAIIKFDTSRTLTVNCYYDKAGTMTKRNAEAIAMTEEPVSSGIYKATVPNIAAGDLIEYLDAEYGWIGDEVYAPLQTATLDTIKAETTLIVADTNEIQGKLPTNKIMGSSDVDNHDTDIDAIKVQVQELYNSIDRRESAAMEVLMESCVAHYKMDDNADSNTVIDEKGNNGTSVRNTSLMHVAGKVGGALSFNGITDFIDTGEVFQDIWRDVSGQGFAISFRFQDLEPSEDIAKVLFGITSNSNEVELRVDTSADEFTVSYIADSAASFSTITPIPAAIANGEMVHIIVTYYDDGEEATIKTYLNGSLIKTSGAVRNASTWTSVYNLYLGAGNASGTPIIGGKFVLDNLMIFNKALSAAEVELLSNKHIASSSLLAQAKADVNAECDTALTDYGANKIAPATPTNVSDAQMAIINAMPDISGLNDISVQDILGASISDDSGATITIQKAIRIMTAWSVGNWRNKSGSNTIRELLDADDGETVILDMVLSRTTPFRTITVRI